MCGRAHTANADHCSLATPVNKKFALLIALSLTGCGGGGGGGSNSPGAPLDAVTVSITRAANGCLLSSNADAEVSGGQGKILLWSCANINAQARVGVEAFYAFDNAPSCFVERSVISKTGDCSKRATSPASPVVSASIRTINMPTMDFIGSGTYALNLDAEVTDTGNVTAFGLYIQVFSTCLSGCPPIGTVGPPDFFQVDAIGNPPLSGLPYILPITDACLSDPTSFQACSGQKAIHIFLPIKSTSTTAGEKYLFTLDVLDFHGSLMGSTTFNLTAP